MGVGRTARMGNDGRSVTLYTQNEYSNVKNLAKRCNAEMEAKMLNRKVAMLDVQEWSQRIWKAENDIKEIMGEEAVERENRIAELQLRKADNLQEHRDEIMARPEKVWHKTRAEKDQQRVDAFNATFHNDLEEDDFILQTKQVGPQQPKKGGKDERNRDKKGRDGPTPKELEERRERNKVSAQARTSKNKAHAKEFDKGYLDEQRPGKAT